MVFIQINLNHCEAAHDPLGQSVQDLDVDVAFISAPSRGQGNAVCANDLNGTCAISTTERYPFGEIIYLVKSH